MSDKITEFIPKYRENSIELHEYPENGLCSIHIGNAAVIRGKPQVHHGAHWKFEVWDDGKLVIMEFVDAETAQAINRHLREFDL